MSGFQPVNTGLAPAPYNRNGEETTPTTPRPNTAPSIPAPQPHGSRIDDATTPTRATFGSLASQRPLPAEPFPAAIDVPETVDSDSKPLQRGDSLYSAKSKESEDVDMDESEGEEDGSDEESLNADGTRSIKKKKSQRFWCTDYPPCNLSFTRSEHLARHIRKHTGERPFQCHCSRRFSRLDNLRQHAQTVHVNEEIPGDSLAATGTRFQRQVRTDRVRPPGNRSRASTAGSQTTAGRGHHRNSLSTSSISSVTSSYSQRPDERRRPTPLVMAGDPRARLSMDAYDQPYRPQSPGGFSTPASATFSNGPNSPRWGSGVASPISSHSRTASLYAGHRTPGRRLSVPSGANPFQSPHGYGPPPLTPINSSNAGFLSPSGSMLTSPTSSTGGSTWSRRESMSSAADEAWRRRTWHPETQSNFTSRLVNVTTPYNYHTQPQQQQTTRLPGIASFDPVPHRDPIQNRSTTPPRRIPSPMLVDTPSRAPMVHTREPYTEDRRNWDMGIRRSLARLDVSQTSADASSWASEANHAVQAQAEQSRAAVPEASRTAPTVRFDAPYPAREHNAYSQPQHISAPPLTPREHKRQAWYQGPVGLQDSRRQRTSPEDSSSSEGVPGTPGSAIATDYHPGIVHSNGWVEPQRPAAGQSATGYGYAAGHEAQEVGYGYVNAPRPVVHGQSEEQKRDHDSMMRLEALVAVATSEENVATAY